MQTFQEVLAKSKKSVFDKKHALVEQQKVQLLESLKKKYMITGKLKELPPEKQSQMLNALLEYWDQKNGINKEGIKFLNEGKISINERSSKENIKMFAEQEVKDNILDFTNAFKMNRGKLVVEKLQQNIESKTGKKIKFDSLFENTLNIINKKIKQDNLNLL